MINWKSVNEQLPDTHKYVMVACAGGNVDKTFFNPEWEQYKLIYGEKSSYRREYLGKNSRYFDLAHKFGYKIMFWAEVPEPPSEVYTDGEDL